MLDGAKEVANQARSFKNAFGSGDSDEAETSTKDATDLAPPPSQPAAAKPAPSNTMPWAKKQPNAKAIEEALKAHTDVMVAQFAAMEARMNAKIEKLEAQLKK